MSETVMPKNHGKAYTQEDIKIMKDMLSYATYTEIAKRLGRTPKGIDRELQRRGLVKKNVLDLLSASELAKKVGVNGKVIAEWINRYGLTARREYVSLRNESKESQTSRYLIHMEMFWLWVRKNPNVADLRRFEEGEIMPAWAYNLKKRQLMESPLENEKQVRWNAKEEELLKSIMDKEDFDITTVAKQLGKTEMSVKKKVGRIEKKRMKDLESFILDKYQVLDIKRKLKHLHYNRQMTISEMSVEFECLESTIYNLFAKKGILLNAEIENKVPSMKVKKMSLEDTVKVKYKVKDAKRKLKSMYHKDDMTIKEIAEELGSNASAVQGLFIRLGIETDAVKKKGRNKEIEYVFVGEKKLKIEGKKKSKGYMYLKAPGHPEAGKSGLVAEHRLVKEVEMGRFLSPEEKVLRKNEDRLDNRPENLYIHKKGQKHAIGFVRIGDIRLKIEGKRVSKGSVYIKISEHPNASKEGYVGEQRLVMEQEMGRFLYPWEQVNRVNSDKSDNRPENLYVIEIKKRKREYQRMAN